MVPIVAEPPAVPFTDQVTDLLELPDTATLNWKESPARMFALAGDTTTLTKLVGGGVCLFDEVDAAQPAINSSTNTMPRWSNLRIFSDTPQEQFKRAVSLQHGQVGGYWTKGQKWANDLDSRRDSKALSR
jgi:hypothetical protein